MSQIDIWENQNNRKHTDILFQWRTKTIQMSEFNWKSEKNGPHFSHLSDWKLKEFKVGIIVFLHQHFSSLTHWRKSNIILEGSRHPNFMNPFEYGQSKHQQLVGPELQGFQYEVGHPCLIGGLQLDWHIFSSLSCRLNSSDMSAFEKVCLHGNQPHDYLLATLV